MDSLFEDNYACDDPEGFLYMVENYSDGTSIEIKGACAEGI
ncbi:MAG: hypothetical protein ACLVKR_06160 [Lachnospiraceae bacterium]